MAETPVKSKKRVVKNPETFRERAAKSAQEGDKPKKRTKVKGIFGQIISPVAKFLKKVFGPILRTKPFRLLGKIFLPEYFRSSWRELKLVKWPTIKQSYQLTFAVLVFAFVFGVTVAVVDYGLDKIFRNVLLK